MPSILVLLFLHHAHATSLSFSGPVSLWVCTPTSTEIGLQLSMPIISAGGFSSKCDFKPNLQRVLPPARKVSSFFTEFWKFNHKVKPAWDSAYFYKKSINTEDCFW